MTTEASTIDCPMCGEEIKSLAKKCKHCGEFLAKAAEAVIQPENKDCPACGEEIKFIAKKCKHCGENFSTQQTSPSQPTTNTSTQNQLPQGAKPTTALVLGILSLLGCGLLGILLAVPAIVIGNKTTRIMNADQPGYGKAKAGTICGYVGVVIGVLWTLLVIASM